MTKTPARVRFRALPKGRREDKFKALAALSLDGKDWIDCPADWRAPFLPAFGGKWADFAALGGLFVYDGSGVMPGRTWIIAPDKETLEWRWGRLVKEKDVDKREELFHPHEGGDKTSTKASKVGLSGHEFRSHSIASDTAKAIKPVRYAFRTLDRQWIIPDNRLINRPNPTLWKVWSAGQVFVTAPDDSLCGPPGPAITFAPSCRTCITTTVAAAGFIRSGRMPRRRNRMCMRKPCRRSPQRSALPSRRKI